jgi:hypothetical protein
MLARPKKTIVACMLGQPDEIRRLRRVKFGEKDGAMGSAPPLQESNTKRQEYIGHDSY